jgi:hypothetical protein
MANAPNNNPEQPLIAVLPRPVVIGIAIADLVVATALLLWALRIPTDFEGTFTRFVLSLGLALFAGVFLFILYPWNYRLTKIPGIDVSVELAGPAVLVIVLFLFINRYMPAPESGRLHVFVDAAGREADAAEFANAKLQFTDVLKPEFHLVPSADGRYVYGVYIRYPENTHAVNGELSLGPVFQPEKLSFARDSALAVKLALKRRGE